MKTEISPLNEKIVVKRVEAKSQTEGGIYIPEQAKEKPREGIVREVGVGKIRPDGQRSAMQVSVGDVVLFSSYAGTEIRVDDEDLLIMSEDDVLAIIRRKQ